MIHNVCISVCIIYSGVYIIYSLCIIYSGLNVKITKKYAYSSPIISTFWRPESIIRNILQANYYRPQRSWCKVIFSQTSVILRGSGGCMARGGMCGGGHAGGHAWQGCVHGGRHAWQGGGHAWGVCMAGGMHGGGCAWKGGMHDMHVPPGRYYGYGIRSMSGRYTSYWNAFLYTLILQVINFRQDIRIQTDTPWIMLP